MQNIGFPKLNVLCSYDNYVIFTLICFFCCFFFVFCCMYVLCTEHALCVVILFAGIQMNSLLL